MKIKKTMALLLALVLVLSNFSFSLAEPGESSSTIDILRRVAEEAKAYMPRESLSKYSVDPEKIVSVIVELKDESALGTEAATKVGSGKFLQSKEGQSKVKSLENKQNKLQSEIKKISESAEFSYSYTNLINGFAMSVKVGDLQKISKLDGVKGVYEDTRYELPTPKMGDSIDIVMPGVGTNLQYKGEGKVIAVIDTGVDVNHKVMAIKTGTGRLTKNDIEAKLTSLKAYGLLAGNGDTLTIDKAYHGEKFPFTFDYADKDTDASVGDGYFDSEHGVHVTGSVGANSTEAAKQGKKIEEKDRINGVAPNAQILGMKVFKGDEPGADTSDILAAIEDAITLGADGINMSLGVTAGFASMIDSFAPGQLNYETLFEKARKVGVSVVCAASNDYRTGDGHLNRYLANDPLVTNPDAATVGEPSTYNDSLSVASANNSGVVKNILKIGDKKFDSSEAIYPEQDSNLKSGSFRKIIEETGGMNFVYCGVGAVQGENYDDPEQDDFKGKDVKGKIALIERGANYFYQKVINAKKAGAKACIIMNSEDGGGIIGLNISYDMYGEPVNSNDLIPAMSISYDDGKYMRDNLSDKKVDGVDTEDLKGMMSSFSSWGSTPDLKLKPEISAPGGRIYSTVSDDKYETYNGTSMASPHVAGGTAVVSQYLDAIGKTGNLKDRALLIENILMSTAVAITDKNNVQFSPRQQGAGMMNLVAATHEGGITYLKNNESGKAKVELGAFNTSEQTVSFNIINDSDKVKVYDIIPSTILEDYYEKSGLKFISKNMKDVTGSTTYTNDKQVTVNPNETKVITVKFALDAAVVDAQNKVFTNGFFVDGFVTLKSADETAYPSLSIPYTGFYGDWSKPPVFDTLDYPDLVEKAKNEGINPYFQGSGLLDLNIDRMQIYKVGVDLTGKVSHSKYIAISPDGDMDHDVLWFKVDTLRNVRDVKLSLKKKDGTPVETAFYDLFSNVEELEDNKIEYVSKSYYNPSSEEIVTGLDGVLWFGMKPDGETPLPEGDYIVTLTATPVAPVHGAVGNTPQTMDIPVKIDLTLPKVTAKFDDAKKEVTVTATDDTGVDYIIVTGYEDPSLETMASTVAFKFEKNKTVTLKYENFKYGRPYATMIGAVDAAGNIGIAEDNRLKVENVTIDNKNYDGTTEATVSAITVKSPDGKTTLERDTDYIVTAEFEQKDAAELLDVYVKVVLTEEGKKKVGEDIAESGTTKWANILPAELTLESAKITPKVYDGKTDAALEDVTLAGVAAGEKLEFKKDFDATAEFDSPDASPTAPATVKITLNEESMVTYNYKIKNAEEKTTGLISPQKIKISSAKVEDKTYDGTTDAIVSAVGFSPDLKFVADKDYEAKGIFAGSDAGENVDATVTVTMKNTNYKVDGPFTTKATIHKAERTVKLAYTIKPVNGQYVVIIEKVAGALYNFGDGWTDKNEFTAAKGSKLQLGIRLPEDKNYKEASAKISITVEATGATPMGDNTNILIWIGLLALAMCVMMFTQQSRKSKFEL